MNSLEKQMVDALKVCSESGALSVKAEFEAEGTRMDELLRLVDVARAANLKLTLKIGGCEAIRDLLEAKQIGANFIVAPMIETSYALSKFVGAVNLAYAPDERSDTQFLFNIETITAFENMSEIVEVAVKGGLDGIVFGRVDFTGSMNLSRESVEQEEVTRRVLETAKEAKSAKLDLVVGGAISSASLPQLRLISSVHLTRFETRKVVFSPSFINDPGIERGLLGAIHFELLWLLNKRNYYSRITDEDVKRIEMLEKRWNVLKTGLK